MKSKAICLALLAFAFSASAAPVSSSQAAAAVRAWIKSGPVLGVRLGAQVDAARVRTYAGDNGASFYAVPLVNGGTVYTSADTEHEPVVAFTPGNRPLSEDSPLYALLRRDAALRKRLAELRTQVAEQNAAAPNAKTSGLPSALTTADAALQAQAVRETMNGKWTLLLDAAKTAAEKPIGEADAAELISDLRVAPLLKTRWSQTTHDDSASGFACYNMYTPEVTSADGRTEKAPCGCTATATAQLMRHFAFPDSLAEVKTFKCKVNGAEVDLSTLDDGAGQPRPYDWANMPDVPSVATADDPVAFGNIGHLVYDVGVALNTVYDYGSAGAYPDDIAKVLTGTFGYANAYSYWDGRFSPDTGTSALHNDGVRARIVYANLDANRPVVFGIYGYAKRNGVLTEEWGGHSVVADGYGFTMQESGSTAYVHVNLGWSGTDDAWYNIPEIDTAEAGALVGDSSGFDFMYLSAAIFNVSTDPADVGKEILSGRVTDEAGEPVANADVRVTKDGAEVWSGKTNAKGIYSLMVDGDASYRVAAKHTDAADPSRILVAELIEPVAVGRMVADEDRVVRSSSGVGNCWGVDLVLAEPVARLNGDDSRTFASLNAALAAAADNDRVEILRPARLYPATSGSAVYELRKTLTIVSTNDRPQLAPIVRVDGALLKIRAGTVALTNVAFRCESTPPVRVETPAAVTVAGTVILDDAVSGSTGLTIADPSCFRVVGLLENAITLDCDGRSGANQTIGSYVCDDDVARISARRIISSKYGTNRAAGIQTLAPGVGSLVWVDNMEVDEAVAGVCIPGANPVFYRTLDDLLAANENWTTILLLKSGMKLGRTVTVSGDQTITGPGDVEIVVHPQSGAKIVVTGSLALKDVTFSGGGPASGSFIEVDGANARLRTDNVEFRDLASANRGGAIWVLRGAAELRNTTFGNCSGKQGGAILADRGASLAMHSGWIAGCRASQGGAIYAKPGAALRLEGDVSIRGNFADWSGADEPDDIWLQDATATLTVGEGIDGLDRIGVRYFEGGAEYGNEAGKRFARVDSAVSNPAEVAWAFFSNGGGDSVRPTAVADGGVTYLVWEQPEAVDYQVDPALARVRVVKTTDAGAETGYFAYLEHAFGWIDSAATVELRSNLQLRMEADLTVTNAVVLRPAASVGGQVAIARKQGESIVVKDGGELVLEDIILNGQNGDTGLILVDGGTLRLKRGTLVRYVNGSRDRASGAVALCNGSKLYMESGAEISDCRNGYVHPANNGSYGGGILADNSTVYLYGGKVTGCYANEAGGVFIGNNSRIYVGGDAEISGNEGIVGRSNLIVADDSELLLSGEPFTGSIGCREGASANPQVIGRVCTEGAEKFLGTAADAMAAAQLFVHDATGDAGLLVTNATEMLLVWGSTLDADGNCEIAGKRYALAAGGAIPVALPEGTDCEYDGTEKRGLEDGVGYVVVSGNVATNAGVYSAKIAARPGYELVGGDTVEWRIWPAWFVLEGIAFEDRTFAYDGQPKSLAISGEMPEWLQVEYVNNGLFAPGTNEVQAVVTARPAEECPMSANYRLLPDPTIFKAKLIVEDPDGRYEPPAPPSPQYVSPGPIGVASVVCNGDTVTLVVTGAVQWCNYRVFATNSLEGGFAVTDADDRALTVPVTNFQWQSAADEMQITLPATDDKCFWKVDGQKGVPPSVP